MHSFEVHSNESAGRKSGRLGLEQVYKDCCIQCFQKHISSIKQFLSNTTMENEECGELLSIFLIYFELT